MFLGYNASGSGSYSLSTAATLTVNDYTPPAEVPCTDPAEKAEYLTGHRSGWMAFAQGIDTEVTEDGYQTGKLGVDLACASNNLRCQDKLTLTANRQAYGRNCLEVGGVWIDEAFKAETKTVNVKAQSEAYFAILAKQPKMKDVFRLGNHLVWVTPSKTALVIDTDDGKDKLSDEEIEKLFVVKK